MIMRREGEDLRCPYRMSIDVSFFFLASRRGEVIEEELKGEKRKIIKSMNPNSAN